MQCQSAYQEKRIKKGSSIGTDEQTVKVKMRRAGMMEAVKRGGGGAGGEWVEKGVGKKGVGSG